MTNGGSFISEVFRDGRIFFFEASFTPWRWSSHFWDEWGASHGSIACQPTVDHLEGEALEDAVCDWVHRAVFNDVGFALESRPGLHRLPLRHGACAEASNAHYYADFSEPEAPHRDAGPDAERLESKAAVQRNGLLRQQSGTAMARFCLAAGDFQRSWQAHGAGFRLLHSGDLAKPPVASSPAAFPPHG
jgi:hypothetical protein